MEISISAQHFHVSKKAQEYIEQKLSHLVHKYFEEVIKVDVHLSKRHQFYDCNVILHDGVAKHHASIKSNGSCDEVYSSFDIASAKLEKQLRKYKSKLKSRHGHGAKITNSLEATKYIIPSQPYDDADDGFTEGNPAIITEHPITINTLSVGDAIMKMDLENLPAVMFRNITTNRINMVYHKNDGNIAWVDTK